MTLKSYHEVGDELAPGVNKPVRVYIVQNVKSMKGIRWPVASVTKGLVSLIMPEEDMPFLPDGTPC